MFQEHHVMQDRLGELQDQVRHLGYRGLWGPAVPSDSGKRTTGGVGIVTKPYIAASVPAGLASHIVEPGRICAAHVHRGVPGGSVAFSAYFLTSTGAGLSTSTWWPSCAAVSPRWRPTDTIG